MRASRLMACVAGWFDGVEQTCFRDGQAGLSSLAGDRLTGDR